jgi:hypothetical protein
MEKKCSQEDRNVRNYTIKSIMKPEPIGTTVKRRKWNRTGHTLRKGNENILRQVLELQLLF